VIASYKCFGATWLLCLQNRFKFSTSIKLGSVTENLISFPGRYNELYHTGTTPFDTGLPYIGISVYRSLGISHFVMSEFRHIGFRYIGVSVYRISVYQSFGIMDFDILEFLYIGFRYIGVSVYRISVYRIFGISDFGISEFRYIASRYIGFSVYRSFGISHFGISDFRYIGFRYIGVSVYWISVYRSFGISDFANISLSPPIPRLKCVFWGGENNGQVTVVEVCRQGLKIVFVLRRLSHHRDMKRKI